jgi:DNA-binding transcriptional LysR family regulator
MDGFVDIGVFTRVVEAHGFTKAARSLGLTTSGVSRVIGRLEARLGVRLIQRTTRSMSLTDDGAAYYARCKKILGELEDAESALAQARAAPRGRLRVDAPTVLSRFMLGPALPGFLTRYPEIAIDLSVRDHVIDPIAEGIDVTLRFVEPRITELVARRLGTMRMVVVGSPRYFARHGRPRNPEALAQHELLGFLVGGTPLPWQFSHHTVAGTGRFNTSNADARREAALAGIGLSQMFEFHVADELARGRLEVVLATHEPPPKPIYALYAQPRAMTPKIRVFLDWITELVAARTAK